MYREQPEAMPGRNILNSQIHFVSLLLDPRYSWFLQDDLILACNAGIYPRMGWVAVSPHLLVPEPVFYATNCSVVLQVLVQTSGVSWQHESRGAAAALLAGAWLGYLLDCLSELLSPRQCKILVSIRGCSELQHSSQICLSSPPHHFIMKYLNIHKS